MTSPGRSEMKIATVKVIDLRCQVPRGVLAIGDEAVRLSWRVESADQGMTQLAYEIEIASDPAFKTNLTTSGEVAGAEQVAVEGPGVRLKSREVRFHRVRIRTEAGWTSWSPVLRVEAGLLNASDWTAQAVTLPHDPGSDSQSPSPVLRRQFEVGSDIVGARLYATSLGVHRLSLNGTPVTEDLLAPGWSTYRHRLIGETYDVTALLAPGPNVMAGVLGDGWYRGRLGWDPRRDRGHYGTDVGLVAQLEVRYQDGTIDTVATDESWLVTTAEIRSADLYDGSDIDMREALPGREMPGYDASGWQSVVTVPLDPALIQPRVAPPVRIVETLAVTPTEVPGSDHAFRLDGGQNISGFVRLRVRGIRGDVVTVRHAEVLEADGALHTRSLRTARATDTYTLADDRIIELEPAFTFHGFRYAEVETDAQLLGAEFVAISSDNPRRGHFTCSDERLTKLHQNVVWSQLDNFVSVPSDCPQRDERLGWTGDAQAFAPTASTLFDVGAFWSSWLADLALDQDSRLGVSTLVPDVVLTGESRFGRAGWADAATMVPWAVYQAYGDLDILRRTYDSMRDHVESLRGRQGDDGLLGESMQFGDWLDPDAPVDRPWDAKANSRFLANAFFVHSARLLVRVAELLGRHDDRARHTQLASEVAARTWAAWSEHVGHNQTAAAVALCFRIVPDDGRTALASGLARLVREADGRVATGFLGTPLVLPALSDAGYFDEAYLMLLRSEVPSWLYQVKQGATTVWERWDAILPDGSIHPGTMTAPPEMPDSDRDDSHMLSFNHYAYGAVIDWVYRHVAGLSSDPESPGYRHVILAPRPPAGLEWAGASVESAYGTVRSEWRMEQGDFIADVELPFGTTGTFLAPVTDASSVRVDGAVAESHLELGPGRHTIIVVAPLLASPSAGLLPPGSPMAAM